MAFNNIALHVLDCEELTGIEFCEECRVHPPQENDPAECEKCADGYFLKDQIHNGTDAECIGKTKYANDK